MNVGFIGTGEIAEALIEGITGQGHKIYVSNRSNLRSKRLSKEYTDVIACENDEVCSSSDIIFICLMAPVARAILPKLNFRTDHQIISVMAHRMGTTGLTAQAVGKKDNQEIIALLSRTLLIGITAGLVLILINDFIFWGSFKVSPASEEVENLAYSYMKIRIYSAPAAISIFGILGWLIAQERTRMVLLLQLWMNGSNILLDFLFVIGFHGFPFFPQCCRHLNYYGHLTNRLHL